MDNNNNQVSVQQPRPLKLMIKDEEVQERFKQILGDGSPAFLMSVLNCANNNDKLRQAEPQSVLMAAAVAATLKLPIDPNLGLAYIIPFNEKIPNTNPTQWRNVAQFQIGYKGIINLCLRTKEYHRINAMDVRDGEIKFFDHLTGDITFQWVQDYSQRNKLPIIGYVGYFRLDNGFEKMHFMPIEQIEIHAKKYSKTYGKGFGVWADDKDGMSKKTVLKLLLGKYGPKSVDIIKMLQTDQSVIEDYDAQKVRYIDNDQPNYLQIDTPEQQENARIISFIENCNNIESLLQFDNMELTQEIKDLLKTTKVKLLKNGIDKV